MERTYSHACPEEERLGATQTWEAFALFWVGFLELWAGMRKAKIISSRWEHLKEIDLFIFFAINGILKYFKFAYINYA